jgi:hypothetical protein
MVSTAACVLHHALQGSLPAHHASFVMFLVRICVTAVQKHAEPVYVHAVRMKSSGMSQVA